MNTIHQIQSIANQRITNEQKSVRVYLKALLADLQISLEQLLFIMEYTGKYNFPLLEVLEELEAYIWQVNPFHLSHQDEFRPHQAMRLVLSRINFNIYLLFT